VKLHEYQSKRIFAQYGIPVQEGEVATTPQEVRALAEQMGCPVVVKAQVLVGGRGKAGGIKLAHTPQEAEEVATRILSLQIKGLPVRKCWWPGRQTSSRKSTWGLWWIAPPPAP
jgi:succinyl-CoA synthetase (ADP-forming) beta subunit (EC 6.2.1.5)